MIKTSVHEHPLRFEPNFPAEWYCEMAEENRCLSSQKNQLEYRAVKVYLCSDCNFFLCENDAKRYQLKDSSKTSGLSDSNKIIKGKSEISTTVPEKEDLPDSKKFFSMELKLCYCLDGE